MPSPAARHGLRGHLHVAEQQHGFELMIRDVEHQFIVLLHQQASPALRRIAPCSVRYKYATATPFRPAHPPHRIHRGKSAYSRRPPSRSSAVRLVARTQPGGSGRAMNSTRPRAARSSRIQIASPETARQKSEAVLEIHDVGLLLVQFQVPAPSGSRFAATPAERPPESAPESGNRRRTAPASGGTSPARGRNPPGRISQ